MTIPPLPDDAEAAVEVGGVEDGVAPLTIGSEGTAGAVIGASGVVSMMNSATGDLAFREEGMTIVSKEEVAVTVLPVVLVVLHHPQDPLATVFRLLRHQVIPSHLLLPR